MIDRPLLLVEGPAGSGKTTLIEAFLGSVDLDVTCVRAIRDSALRRPKEVRTRQDPELKRYRGAGASLVTQYRFPPCHADVDAFYDTKFMADFCEAVVIEGDNPIGWVDLRIFVAPPPGKGETLLCRVLRDRESERRTDIDRIEAAIRSPEDAVRLLLTPFGDAAVRMALEQKGTAERVRSTLAAHLETMRGAASQKPTEHWAITSRYSGIERGQVVVANVRGEGERAAGEALLQELARIRKDPEVYRDIFGVSGNRTPITAVVADLTDSRDPGLTKALRRIRRVAARSRD